MQIEITLLAEGGADYSARDLGFLLHKHPDHVHTKKTSEGEATVFYPEESDERTTAILHLDVDPVGLVRGKNQQADGLLAQYVNDRPYVANSFLGKRLCAVAAPFEVAPLPRNAQHPRFCPTFSNDYSKLLL